ncbi:hypothetical protein EK21DRAFT_70317, partial [Setomelanomma holmii]
LRQTCKHFHSIIPSLGTTVSALLVSEQSDAARAENIFTCVVCVRLRRAGEFTDAHRKGLWGRDGEHRHARFCIRCGTRPPSAAEPKFRFKKGDSWTRFGLPYVFCAVCRSVKRGAKERKTCKVCPACWEKGEGRKG